MADPLRWFRPLVQTRAEAVRWACVLEATAPKPGNVHPGRPFCNLSYVDFVEAAEITARCLDRPGRISDHMLEAVLETASRLGTNVNLGIILLLGPLVAADRSIDPDPSRDSNSNAAHGPNRERGPGMEHGPSMDGEAPKQRDPSSWRDAIVRQLDAFDPQDGQTIFRAIASAAAGGLGEVDEMDVHATHDSIDLVAAMKLAADRDRIARQYVNGFADVIDQVAPLLADSIGRCGDILQGICQAHVRLLAAETDSLIARKNGREVARQVQERAQSVDWEDGGSVAAFDAFLRDSQQSSDQQSSDQQSSSQQPSQSHRLNPGTTADLIAAGLYLLLRTPTPWHLTPITDPKRP